MSDDKTSREIEREIETERAQLTGTIRDLQDRVSVESMVREVGRGLRDNGSDMAGVMGRAVRDNPMALALTGVGLAWLIFGQGRSGSESGTRVTSWSDERRQTWDRKRWDDDRLRSAAGENVARRSSYGDSDSRGWSANAGLDTDTGRTFGDRFEGSRDRLQRAADSGSSWASSGGDAAKDAAGAVRDRAAGAAGSVSDAAHGAADRAKGAYRSAADAASGAYDSASGRAASAYGAASDAVSGAAQGTADAARGAAHRVSDATHNAQDRIYSGARRVRASAADLRDRVSHGLDDLSADARDRVIAAREAALDARHRAEDLAMRGGRKAADFHDRQPLFSGAVALALGAAIGGMLPRTQMEDDWMGDESDRLMDEAERVYGVERERLQAAAHKVVDAGKTAAGDVADAASKAVRDGAGSVEQAVKDAGATVAGSAKEATDDAKAAGKDAMDRAQNATGAANTSKPTSGANVPPKPRTPPGSNI